MDRYDPTKQHTYPHPKEFEKLVGPWKNHKEKLEHLSLFVQKNQLICALKGAHTAIALPN